MMCQNIAEGFTGRTGTAAAAAAAAAAKHVLAVEVRCRVWNCSSVSICQFTQRLNRSTPKNTMCLTSVRAEAKS